MSHVNRQIVQSIALIMSIVACTYIWMFCTWICAEHLSIPGLQMLFVNRHPLTLDLDAGYAAIR